MPHAIRPYEDQRNRATLNGKPLPTAIEIQFPETFGARARHVIEDLGDTIFLFIANGRFIVTDEACMLDEGSARWSGDSLEALEEWLEEQARLKDAEEPGWEQPYTILNLNCNHLRASFPLCLCVAAVNDALHRLPTLRLGRTKNLLRICSLLD